MKIIFFTEPYISQVKDFTDLTIGRDYYSVDDLKTIIKKSHKDGLCSSVILVNEQDQVIGLRLSYPPGQWIEQKEQGQISTELWERPPLSMAYFQSIFLSDQIRGQGWGARLSKHSMEILKKMGAKGIVCHSWKESPHNSSRRYLEKMGFQAIKDHPRFWFYVDYECVRCGKPCLCTATEMVFYL